MTLIHLLCLALSLLACDELAIAVWKQYLSMLPEQDIKAWFDPGSFRKRARLSTKAAWHVMPNQADSVRAKVSDRCMPQLCTVSMLSGAFVAHPHTVGGLLHAG